MPDAESLDTKLTPLRKGLLEFAVLSVISRRKEYAADILEQLANTPFTTGEGSLYPLLSRLKRESCVAYEWAESSAGPPRKYYRLTAEGMQRLHDLRTYWHNLYTTLETLGGTS